MNSRPACCMHAVRVRCWHGMMGKQGGLYLVLVSVRSSWSSSVLRVPILRKIRIRIRGKHDYAKDLEEAGDLEPSLLVGSLWSVEGSVRQVFQSTSLKIGERHAGSGWQLDRIRREKEHTRRFVYARGQGKYLVVICLLTCAWRARRTSPAATVRYLLVCSTLVESSMQ